MCGADDFYTAMHEHNVVLEREASSAMCMMAKALLGEKKEAAGGRVAVSLGMKEDETLFRVPVGETVESFSTQLPDDTAGRRVRLSLARKKYEHMMSVADIDELEDGDTDDVRQRLRRKLVERQKGVVLSELRQSTVSPVFQCEKGAVLGQLAESCTKLAPGEESVIAMEGVAEGKRVRRFAADSACNVHLTGDEGDLTNATNVHFRVVGTAGASDVTKTGTVVGTALDQKGDKVEFRFKCSALKGLSMNLLSLFLFLLLFLFL